MDGDRGISILAHPDQWAHCRHDQTALLPGGGVQLTWAEAEPGGAAGGRAGASPPGWSSTRGARPTGPGPRPGAVTAIPAGRPPGPRPARVRTTGRAASPSTRPGGCTSPTPGPAASWSSTWSSGGCCAGSAWVRAVRSTWSRTAAGCWS